MSIWAVANQKGGVGKTTTAISLAAHLARRRQRVLMVDLDPHGSLTTWLRFSVDDEQPGVLTLFQQAASDQALQPAACVHATEFEGLELMPAHAGLAALDRRLGSKPGMGKVLAQALSALRNRYDHIFIDCPPMLGVLMINALAAADHLILPVQTEFLALKGLQRMLRTLEMLGKSSGRALPYTIVPTLYDKRTRASLDSFQTLQKEHGTRLWPRFIPVDTRFREASRQRKPLPLMQPGARGSMAYAVLLDHLLQEEQAHD